MSSRNGALSSALAEGRVNRMLTGRSQESCVWNATQCVSQRRLAAQAGGVWDATPVLDHERDAERAVGVAAVAYEPYWRQRGRGISGHETPTTDFCGPANLFFLISQGQ